MSGKPASGGTCPICGAATEHRYRPFCSGRCADVDLGRWLGGQYVVPGTAEDEDEAPLPDPDSPVH